MYDCMTIDAKIMIYPVLYVVGWLIHLLIRGGNRCLTHHVRGSKKVGPSICGSCQRSTTSWFNGSSSD